MAASQSTKARSEGKKAAAGPLNVTFSAATSRGRKRPEFLVLFRERSERNTSLIADTLGVKELQGIRTRTTCTLLNKRSEAEARPRVYPILKIAAVDLNPDERDALGRDDGVAKIVKNEVRSIPPVFEAVESPDYSAAAQSASPPAPLSAYSVAGTAASSLFLTQPDLLRINDPLVAYLSGVRDTAALAIRLAELLRDRPGLPPVIAARYAADTDHSWCLSLIGLHAGYTKATGKGIRVAVLDTGIDLNHPDFQGRFGGGNDTESFVGGESVDDGNGHGTHCAGVIGGRAAAPSGRRYCVAPDAELVIGKVLSDAGSGSDDQIIDGIDWAANTADARVISMSLGSARRRGEPYPEAYEAVAEALLSAKPGVLLLAASGNDSARPDFIIPVGNPAACPSIAAVAAVDRNRQVASFSCGQVDSIGTVDFAAPGVAVYSAWTGGGYKTISGTSMATPHVAGVAALFAEADPTLTGQQLWERVRKSCQPLGRTEDFGVGLVQVP